MTLVAFLEALAYAISRGAVRAYLDVLQERATAVEELPIDADRARARRVAAAVAAVERLSAAAGSAPGPVDPAPRGG